MNRVVRLYTGFQFFFGLLIWVPIYYEYQRRSGLTPEQILGIQSIYYLAFCVLEVPTGWIADRVGYRFCMRAGAVVVTLANALPIVFAVYPGFLVHFLLVALARSLISGASSAYLYEFLKAQGKATAYRDIEGNARAYGLIGKVVCWGVVGFLMNWRADLPYVLTAVATAISVVYAFRLPAIGPAQPVDSASTSSPGKGSWLGAGAALRSSPFLALLMVQGVAIFVLSRVAQVDLFQPLLGSKGFDVSAYGWTMSLMALAEAVGSSRFKVFSPLRGKLSDLALLFVITVGLGALLWALPWSGGVATIAILCLFAWATGLAFPVQKQLLNDAIPDSRYRATLLSIESILDRAACAASAALSAVYLGAGRLDAFFAHSALATWVFVIVVASLFRLLKYFDIRPRVI